MSHRVAAKSSGSQAEALVPPPNYIATVNLNGWTELKSSRHLPERCLFTQECHVTSLI